jgi:hypothetical protein
LFGAKRFSDMNRALRCIASRSGHRGYATRPLPRPKDPLSTSKTAVISEIAPGITFIHRSPPAAPTPHSLTTAPSSPLLQKSAASPDARTASPSLSIPSPAAGSSQPDIGSLPPVLRSGPPERRYHLAPAQVEKMRSLRASDPETYTVSVLAKQFDCSRAFVQITAPASNARRAALNADSAKQKAGWGHRKRLQREIRQKRRSFW